MEESNRQNKRILIIGIIVIVLFIGFATIMVKMIKENGKCIDDPFTYSAIKLKESGGDYACRCDSLNLSLLDFTFSEEGIKIINVDEHLEVWNLINISGIEVKGGTEE